MKERGMIFNTEEVRGFLERGEMIVWRPVKFPFNTDSERVYSFGIESKDPYLPYCPYGRIGDRVYARETFAFRCANPKEDPEYSVMYKANGGCIMEPRWKPSIHMPKWAARIWLEIADVEINWDNSSWGWVIELKVV